MSVVSRDVPACPLCGSPAVLVDSDDELDGGIVYTVLCTNPEHCGLGSGFHKTITSALNTWERRKEYAENVKRERREKA